VAVIDAAGDDGAVGVAVDELDDHLHADPRDHDRTPAGAGPPLGDADPARGGVVERREPVPVKQNLYPPVLVGVNLFALGPGDDPGLHADRARPRGGRAAPRDVVVDALELVDVADCLTAGPKLL